MLTFLPPGKIFAGAHDHNLTLSRISTSQLGFFALFKTAQPIKFFLMGKRRRRVYFNSFGFILKLTFV